MKPHQVARPVLAGNWKMNRGPQETAAFFDRFLPAHEPAADRTVIVFPPALSVAAAAAAIAGRDDIQLGVQHVHWEATGAFTGEVSAVMAAQAGAHFALAGHSERRHLFGETDEQVGRKAAAALGAYLVPVACIGETLAEREAGQLREVLLRQLDAILGAVPAAASASIVIAYEPVWAIGTGVHATPADAAEAHAIIRQQLAAHYDDARAAVVPILYGGSVKPANARELLAADGVDGLLVGGASLDPDEFAAICRA